MRPATTAERERARVESQRRLSVELSRASTAEAAAGIVLTRVIAIAKAIAGGVALAHEDGYLEFVAVRGLADDDASEMPRLAIDDAAASSEAFRTGREVMAETTDAFRSRYPAGYRISGGEGRAVWALPLVVQGAPIGAVVLVLDAAASPVPRRAGGGPGVVRAGRAGPASGPDVRSDAGGRRGAPASDAAGRSARPRAGVRPRAVPVGRPDPRRRRRLVRRARTLRGQLGDGRGGRGGSRARRRGDDGAAAGRLACPLPGGARPRLTLDVARPILPGPAGSRGDDGGERRTRVLDGDVAVRLRRPPSSHGRGPPREGAVPRRWTVGAARGRGSRPSGRVR